MRGALALACVWAPAACGPEAQPASDADPAPRVPSADPAPAARPDASWLRPLLPWADPGRAAALRAGWQRDVAALAPLLGAADPSVRAQAAFALATVAEPTTRPAVLARLADPDARVRRDAVFALASLGPTTEAESALTTLLDGEPDPTVRAAAMSALGRIGGSGAAAALLRTAAVDRRPATAALSLLSRRGTVHAGLLDTLVQRLADPDAEVRDAAAAGVAGSQAPELWIRWRGRIRGALDDMRAGADPAARHLLTGVGRLLPRAEVGRWVAEAPDWRTRVAGLGALANHPDGVIVHEQVAPALRDPHPMVRLAAARLLVDLDVPAGSLDSLEAAAVGRGDAVVEGAYLAGLEAAGRDDAVVARARTHRLDDVVRWMAAAPVLARSRAPGATEVLAGALASREPAVVDAGLRALRERDEAQRGGRLPGSDAASVLASAPPDPWSGDDPPRPDRRELSEEDRQRLDVLGPAPQLLLETTEGTVRIHLEAAQAPATILRLADWVGRGHYGRIPVHRVISGGLVQLGVPGGGPVGPPTELTHVPFRRGVVGWADAGRDVTDDDFFIVLDDLPQLDGRYTAFGWVESGIGAVDRLAPGSLLLSAVLLPSG